MLIKRKSLSKFLESIYIEVIGPKYSDPTGSHRLHLGLNMPPRVRFPLAEKPPPVIAPVPLTWMLDHDICSIPIHTASGPPITLNHIYTMHPKWYPRSCQMGSRQSEWPLAEKGATSCSRVWIGWTFMPCFHVSICKVQCPQWILFCWSLSKVQRMLRSPRKKARI